MRKLILIGILFILFMYGWSKNYKEMFLDRPSKAIVIVEPRKHKDLQRVFTLFDERMPLEWDLYIFCGKTAEDYIKETVKNIKRKVIILPLDKDNLNADEYNALLKQESFYNKINAEDILIFQSDTALCNGSPFNIEDFTKYDYIGCSVNNTSIGNFQTPWNDMPFYGVGGLSFRKKSFVMKCLETRKDKLQLAEDVFFSDCVNDSPNKPPTAKVLSEFCTQNQFHEKSFGAHKIKLLQESDKASFDSYCPESSFLKEQFKNLL
jgi:hypothetical protein